jgi:cyclohexa-1,5-dienecarbonyl-CoA hydratase
MVEALRRAVGRAREARETKAVCLEAEGPHFSYGASVEEHLPGREAAMLAAFHGLLREILDASLVVTAAIRGACLGGGLELAGLCQRVFASPGARLGQPEVSLGVLAPAASVVLPERIGRARAEDLLLTGRTVDAEEALRIGLVDEVAEDPEGAALSWVRTHLLPKSASSLRFAVRAARAGLAERLGRDLPSIERLYLDGLMNTADAVEGLQAFLQKRPPRWRDA